MKRFITTVICLFLPPVILCAVALWTEWNVFCAAVRKPDCTIGIIGDSRSACGVNDAYFPGLANFAQRASQSMVWRAKLGPILRENPQLKKFIIEVSPVSYLRMPDESTSARAAFIRGHIASTVLLDVMCTEDMGGMPSSGFSRNFIRGIIFPFLKRMITFSKVSPLQDNYYALDRHVADTAWWKNGAKAEPSQTFVVPKGAGNGNRDDVEKMIERLQASGVEVVLLTVPFFQHEDDRMLIDGQWPYFEKEMKDLGAKYHIRWINYRRAMPDVYDWADSGHLNINGARKFAELMYRDLKNGKF